MREQFAAALRCPACRAEQTLRLTALQSDALEVREGTLACAACGAQFAVHRGVPQLLHAPAAHALERAQDLERFAEAMRLEGRQRELVRALPDLPDEHWRMQGRTLAQILSTIPFEPGKTILDLGARTCWATNRFAEIGLRAIALDVTTTELQGLHTAEVFLEDGRVFFERVLGSPDTIPLASGSLDYVYCSQALGGADLRRTLAEVFRVLRPGGRLLLVNEPVRVLRGGRPGGRRAMSYRWEATRAGFFTEVMEPHYAGFFGDATVQLGADTTALEAIADGVGFALRRRGAYRRARLAWLNNVWGGVCMNLVATKPFRFTGGRGGVPGRVGGMLAAGALTQAGRALRRPTALRRLPRTPEQAEAAIVAWLATLPPEERPNGTRRGVERLRVGAPGRRAGRRAIVLTGNCQTQGIADAVQALLPDARVSAFHMWGMEDPEAAGERLAVVREEVAGADAWVRMYLGVNADLEGHVRDDARVIELPSITFPAFHPDMVIATTTAGTLFRGLADYHSAIALWAWRRGLSPAQAAGLFTPGAMAALGYDRFWGPSLDALRAEFDRCGLAFGELWARLKREGVFMHTINHPRPAAVALHAKAVVAALTDRDDVWDEPLDGYVSDHLSQVVWPVYPFVADVLGVPGSYRWRFGDRWFGDVESWAQATWLRYEGVPPEIVRCERIDDGRYDAVLSELSEMSRA